MQNIGEIAKKHTYKNKKCENIEMNININAIPNNMETFMAFMLGKHLVFIDRFQFLNSSLDILVRIYRMKHLNTHQKYSKIRNWP